ncbi:MAG: hypothetical protein AAGA66_16600 [Bacteroidota bacterium]
MKALNSMIKVNENKIIELFELFEDLNDFFHNEKNFTPEKVKSFANDNYKRINDFYYDTLWDLLPENKKKEIRG